MHKRDFLREILPQIIPNVNRDLLQNLVNSLALLRRRLTSASLRSAR